MFISVKRTKTQTGKSIRCALQLSGSQLNNGDNHRTILIVLYSYKSNGSHKKLGEFQTNGEELRVCGKQWKFSGCKASCELAMAKVDTKYTFMDYISGGMEMNFVVGIDFTASNGDPANPDSLHFNNGHIPNQYVQAIQAIGEIIQDYDTDKVQSSFNLVNYLSAFSRVRLWSARTAGWFCITHVSVQLQPPEPVHGRRPRHN